MTVPYAREWAAKAEEDYLSAEALLRKRMRPLPNSVCFHAHQCAEKYLKAILAEQRQSVPKTHDLILVLERLIALDGQYELLRDALRALNAYAVEIRYPGESATVIEARRAVRLMRTIRTFIKERLGVMTRRGFLKGMKVRGLREPLPTPGLRGPR